ncbi:MAG: diguanylate cyclase [Candidatus Omnitrophica bacterium]|nr:diguanylate cyclase [Candidatus Omnitrophota bacterium]
MKIRTKTILTFVSACLILAVIYSFVIHELHAFENSSQRTLASEKITELLAETRIGRETLLRGEDLSTITYVQNEITGVIAYTETVAPIFREKQNIELIHKITHTLKEHSHRLQDFILALSNKKELEEKLTENAAALETTAKETWARLQDVSPKQSPSPLKPGEAEKFARNILSEQNFPEGRSQPPLKNNRRRLNRFLTDILRKWEREDLNQSAETYLNTLNDFENAEEELRLYSSTFPKTEEELHTYAATLRSNTREINETQKRRLTAAIAMAFLLSTLTALIVPLWLLNVVIHPLDQLRHALLAVGSGNLNASIDIHSKDEIGDLADSFRQMTAKLKESYDHLFQANQKLAQMTENFRNLALLDALTSLYNRRGFDMFLEQQMSLAMRTQKPFVLLMADVDNLKQINDALGHPGGDRVIRQAGTALKESFRHTDIVSRIGGDEFAVIAIDAKENHAEAFLQNISKKLHQLSEGKGHPLISLSIGYACFDPKSPLELASLINKADEMLYTQKKNKPNHTDSKK